MSSSSKSSKNAGLKFYEAANIFPMIAGDEREAVKASIKANGVQVPVVIYKGEVLDGRNRVDIVSELNKEGSLFKRTLTTGEVVEEPFEVPTTEFTGTEQQALEFALISNFHRRHLTSSQKAAAAVKANLLGRKYAQRAKRKGNEMPAEQEGLGLPTSGDIAAYLARLAGTNRTYIFRALKIGDKNSRTLDKVIAGEMNLNQALAEIEAAEAAAAAPEATAEAAAENAVVDGEKQPVPEDLAPIFEQREAFKTAAQSIRKLETEIENLCRGAAGKVLNEEALLASLKQIKKSLSSGQPHKPCPHCGATGGDPSKPRAACPLCKRAKYVTKEQYVAWCKAEKNGQPVVTETETEPEEVNETPEPEYVPDEEPQPVAV